MRLLKAATSPVSLVFPAGSSLLKRAVSHVFCVIHHSSDSAVRRVLARYLLTRR